jgi:glc operon protein GlcG
MPDTSPALKFTLEGATKLLNAAIAKAKSMNVPQCICIVDAGGHLITMARMDGAFSMSIPTALRKAQTAAAYGIPTGDIPAGLDLKLAIATEGQRVNLLGGIPVIIDGHLVGAIGIGSGTGEQDKEIAIAAVATLPGAKRF